MLEQLAQDYSGTLKFVALDAHNNGDTASEYGIMGLPTLIFFKDGKEAGRMVGAAPKPKVVEALRGAFGVA